MLRSLCFALLCLALNLQKELAHVTVTLLCFALLRFGCWRESWHMLRSLCFALLCFALLRFEPGERSGTRYGYFALLCFALLRFEPGERATLSASLFLSSLVLPSITRSMPVMAFDRANPKNALLSTAALRTDRPTAYKTSRH